MGQFRMALSRQIYVSPGSKENHWEAIRYSLGTRKETGLDADHYGFLQKVGRKFLIIQPTSEWIAVVASLSCSRPDQRCTIREVRTEMESLGLRPSVSELMLQLERAGLARSSPDADDGVYVEAAFGGR